MHQTKLTCFGPMKLFTLFACLLFLPDFVTCQNDVFQVTIVGHELDCADRSCRHTGQIYGNFRHPFKRLPPASLFNFCVDLEVLYCYDRDANVCNHEENWPRHCILWSFCQAEETCHGRGRNLYCSCKQGDPYNFTINPLFDHSWFRVVFRNAWNKFASSKPSEIITASNTFIYRSRKGERVPINSTVSWSHSGNSRLYADSIYLQTGVLLVLCLTELTFLSSFQE
ncbi:uncharacterized protein LOC131949977 [Physella acuta]|uniref:uncharacterized protein LOC131949977 n=1 Tax=Physella acuta TaxID=109671 RepID=UPI0027DBE487|nr:uncharacterized protein LOC131949977 [Physella acuta]